MNTIAKHFLNTLLEFEHLEELNSKGKEGKADTQFDSTKITQRYKFAKEVSDKDNKEAINLVGENIGDIDKNITDENERVNFIRIAKKNITDKNYLNMLGGYAVHTGIEMDYNEKFYSENFVSAVSWKLQEVLKDVLADPDVKKTFDGINSYSDSISKEDNKFLFLVGLYQILSKDYEVGAKAKYNQVIDDNGNRAEGKNIDFKLIDFIAGPVLLNSLSKTKQDLASLKEGVISNVGPLSSLENPDISVSDKLMEGIGNPKNNSSPVDKKPAEGENKKTEDKVISREESPLNPVNIKKNEQASNIVPANKIVAPVDSEPSQVETNTTIEGGMLEYDSSKINNISTKQVDKIAGEFKKTEKGLTKIQTLADKLTKYTKTYSENQAVRTSIKDQLTARGSVHPETAPKFDDKENITNKKEIINIDPTKKEVIENYENAGDAMKKSSKSIGRIIDEGGKWDRKEINIDTNAINNSTDTAIDEIDVYISYTLSNSSNSSNIQSQTSDLLTKDSEKQNTLSQTIDEKTTELPTTSFNDKPNKIKEIDSLKGSHDDLFSTTQDTLQKQNNTIKKVYGDGINQLQIIDKALETRYTNLKTSRDTLDNTRKVLDTQGTTYDKDDRAGDKLIPTIQKMDEILTNLQTSRDSLKSKVDEFTVQLGKENIATKVLNIQNNYVDTKIGVRKLILEKDQKTREKVEVEKGLEVFTNLFEGKTTLKGKKLTMENINSELIELTNAKKASDIQYEQAKTANNSKLRDSSEVKSRELQQTILVYAEYAKGSENYQGLKTKQTTLTQAINTLNGQIDTKAQILKGLETQISTERSNIPKDVQTTIDPSPTTETFKFEPDKDKIPAYGLGEQKTVESADNQEIAQIDPNKDDFNGELDYKNIRL